MRFTVGMAILAGLCGGCGQAGPDERETALRLCKEQAEAMASALVAQNFKAYLDRIYPAALQEMGGWKKAAAVFNQLTRKGDFKVVQLKVGAPDNLIIAGSDVMALVPMEIEVVRDKKNIKGPSYFLGISSDQGKSWTFIDGSHLDARKVRAIVPHFPRNVKLPENRLEEKKIGPPGG